MTGRPTQSLKRKADISSEEQTKKIMSAGNSFIDVEDEDNKVISLQELCTIETKLLGVSKKFPNPEQLNIIKIKEENKAEINVGGLSGKHLGWEVHYPPQSGLVDHFGIFFACTLKAIQTVHKYLSEVPVVALVGSSGAGKTNFANMYAVHELLSQGVDTVIHLRLHREVYHKDFFHTIASSVRCVAPVDNKKLIIIDQANFASSNMLDQLNDFALALAKFNVKCLLVGAGHYQTNPAVIAGKPQQIKLIAVKFRLTKEEYAAVNPGTHKYMYESFNEQNFTLRAMCRPYTGKSLKERYDAQSSERKAAWKKAANDLFMGSIEKILPTGGIEVNVTEVLPECTPNKNNEFAAELVTRAYIQAGADFLKEEHNGVNVFYCKEITETTDLKYFVSPEDGIFLATLLCQKPSCVEERIASAKKLLNSVTPCRAEKGKLEDLIYSHLLDLSARLQHNMGIRVDNVCNYESNEITETFLYHPCSNIKWEEADVHATRSCYKCDKKDASFPHLACYSCKANQGSQNYRGFNYLHIDEQHLGKKKKVPTATLR